MNDYFEKRNRLWTVGVGGRLIEPEDADAIERLWRTEERRGRIVAPVPRRADLTANP